MSIYPVLLAGGIGSRLWPVSRTLYPKQFQSFGGKYSFLQRTIQRLKYISDDVQSPLVVCNEEHRFIVAEQLRQLEQLNRNILLEPIARNTAAAIAVAAMKVLRDDPEGGGILLVLPSDHVIEQEDVFANRVLEATKQAKKGKIVTFGIVPQSAETGYGYIKVGDVIESKNGIFGIDSFVEKPSLECAQEFVESKKYLWNSGIFLFQARHYLNELKQYAPEIYQICERACGDFVVDGDFLRINAEQYKVCPDISVDYAVMEYTQKAVVLTLGVNWSDVGAWDALWKVLEQKDNEGNVLFGEEIITEGCQNNLILSEKGVVATIDVDDLIIINTKDALLVSPKSSAQKVKRIVERLSENNHASVRTHSKVYRPWGSYEVIDMGEHFQVKRITVSVGAKLSLQKHYHRSEHWVVVSGTAKVTLGQDERLVAENQSIYIPLGELHCLENVGKIPLELIEVQTGSYLSEDDIVRITDLYGRV